MTDIEKITENEVKPFDPETMEMYTDETRTKFTPEYANYIFNVLNVDARTVDLKEGEKDFSLCLSAKKFGVIWANAFYRWGGFGESVAELCYLMTKYRRMPMYPLCSDLAIIVRMFSLSGAGFRHDLSLEERFSLKDINYPLTNGANDGIIEITGDGMKRNDEEAKYHVLVDFDQRIFDLSECFIPMSENDMNDMGYLESDVVEYPFQSFYVRFTDSVKLKKFMREVADKAHLIRHDGNVYRTVY